MRWLTITLLALLRAGDVIDAKGTKGVKRNSAMHAKSRKRPPPKKAPKRRRRDFDDYDDDDDDFGGGGYGRQVEPYYRPRRKPTGPTMLQRAQTMAREAAGRGVEMSKVAASRAKVLAAEAAVKGQEASRLAKAYYSSEYEKFLLTATWPSDQRVSPQLAKRLVESVARFPARPHALPDDDPYRVTLRKLWKKMVERDWRTTTKALYLLHALSRSTPTKNARALSRTLKSMVGDADPKTGRKYFSRRELVSLRGDDAGDRGAVVDAYAGFVLRRALLFAAKFDDVSPPKKKKGEEAPTCAADEIDGLALKRAQNALLVLEHALQFLRVALDDPDPRRQHLVVVSCVEPRKQKVRRTIQTRKLIEIRDQLVRGIHHGFAQDHLLPLVAHWYGFGHGHARVSACEDESQELSRRGRAAETARRGVDVPFGESVDGRHRVCPLKDGAPQKPRASDEVAHGERRVKAPRN
mmetsp:Transcript_22805/g.70531  ORF Transcript_22805/g.70531 Transcript_22805/m.70531 type:complete len:466 (-) Transcript_22805:530-1927(-)